MIFPDSYRPTASRRRPAAFTLAELVIALTLLAAASGVMVPLLLSVTSQRRAAEQRQYALVQAENRLDEFLGLPWADITPELLSQRLAARPAHAVAESPRLPDLRQSVAVVDRPEDAAKQITVELRWRNHAGDFTAPVRLSAWKFAPAEAKP